MSGSAEFPANCTTNTYILHEFSEIAYIVCALTVTTSQDDSQERTSPESSSIRLKKAEKQFRQASILAALDAEKSEIFTFYKKSDVVKDQRNILSKFGYVCRLNSCSIARKSAARIHELLKPESHRVFQLFTTAVLSSLQIQSPILEKAVAINSRIYLVPSPDIDIAASPPYQIQAREWTLIRVNLQIIANGQIAVIIQSSRSGALYVLSHLLEVKSEAALWISTCADVYLIPTGQFARLARKDQVQGGDDDADFQQDRAVLYGSERIRQLKIKKTIGWLEDHSCDISGLLDDSSWVDIEVPIFESASSGGESSGRTLKWEPVLWPARLTYVFKHALVSHDDRKAGVLDPDPLWFADQWFNDSAERTSKLAEAADRKSDGMDIAEEPLFSDDVQFDAQGPTQLFEPPASIPNPMIYPTPPDGPLTYVTPAMSSLDGLAPTPMQSTQVHSQPEDGQDEMMDLELQDVGSNSPLRINRDQQVDDLFEEEADVHLDSTGAGDEPNWDFFDQPEFDDMPVPEDTKSTHAVPMDIDAPTLDIKIEMDGATVAGQVSSDTQNSPPTAMSPDTHERGRSSAQASPLATKPEPSMESISPGARTERPVVHRTSKEIDEGHMGFQGDQRMVTSPFNPDSNQSQRRSSLFDGIVPLSKPIRSDTRYQAQGKYWFAPVPTNALGHKPGVTSITSPRPKSSSSSTSQSSIDSESPNGSQDHVGTAQNQNIMWSQYEQDRNTDHPPVTDHLETKVVENQIQKLLAVVELADPEEPFMHDITLKYNTRRRPNYDEQKTLMVAQVLVDQLSQSSLFKDSRLLRLAKSKQLTDVRLFMDHNENKLTIPHVTLGDLIMLQPAASGLKQASRLTSLERPRICVNRGDEEITADLPILRFWDTLGLQPVNGAKDVTAFCIHLAGNNTSEGCNVMLDRIADTYTSCGLGDHRTGLIPGVTNNGLLAWSPNTPSLLNLKATCQKLGTAIASTNTLKGFVVIYMVSPTSDLVFCRDLCHAATVLFEAFIKAAPKQPTAIELALQIVPVSFVALPETLAIPGQAAYIELAIEVYNRLRSRGSPSNIAGSECAVYMDDNQGKMIVFDLDTAVDDPFASDGNCLHLAYSYSLDNRWMTAAWTDQQGVVAFTTSYLLHYRGGGMRVRRDVLHDMWEISHNIMRIQRNKWRLIVARLGHYDPDELSEWVQIASQSPGESKNVAKVVLLSARLDSDIAVSDANMSSKAQQLASNTNPPNTSVTPVSTPQNSTTSPDHGVGATPTPTASGLSHVNAPTPPDQNFDSVTEGDIVLVDPIEESWAAALAFGLTQSSDVVGGRPAAASGLLLKRYMLRNGASGLTYIEVNLLAAPRALSGSSQAERESLLQDILRQFRRLVGLAVTRGCIDRMSECVPWHIATAAKGARILSEAM